MPSQARRRPDRVVRDRPAPPTIASLLKYPENGGIPESAAAAIARQIMGDFHIAAAQGSEFVDVVCPEMVNEDPRAKKSRALKPAWVVR